MKKNQVVAQNFDRSTKTFRRATTENKPFSPVKFLFENFDLACEQGYFLSNEQADALNEDDIFVNPQGIVFINKEQFEGEPKKWGKLYIRSKDGSVNLEIDCRFDRDNEETYDPDIVVAQYERHGIDTDEESKLDVYDREELLEAALDRVVL